MTLTNEEEEFVKEQYANKLKQEQIELLDKEMWIKVEVLKQSEDPLKWVKIVEEKQKCREQIAKL